MGSMERRTARYIVLTVASAALIALPGCGRLDANDFKKDVETLGSLAAEGALLARDVKHGDSTTPFTRVHADELARKAVRLRIEIRGASLPPHYARELAQARPLAERISIELNRLKRAPSDRATAAAVQQALSDASDRADTLATSL
jgi:hypothetical protein